MMIKCKECKKEVSNLADKCPHCGVTLKQSGCTTNLVLLALLIALSVYLSTSSQTKTPISNQPIAQADTKELASMKQLIQGFIDKGALLKVEKISELPHAYITPLFKTLSIDDKRIILGVILKYYRSKDPLSDLVSIYDSQTGKNIGRFDGYNYTAD